MLGYMEGPKSLVLLQSITLDGKTFSGILDKLAYDHSTPMGFPLTILNLMLHYLWDLRLFNPQYVDHPALLTMHPPQHIGLSKEMILGTLTQFWNSIQNSSRKKITLIDRDYATMLVVPSSTAFKSPWDKCKLEASGTAVEQWVKQAKSQDANDLISLELLGYDNNIFEFMKPDNFQVLEFLFLAPSRNSKASTINGNGGCKELHRVGSKNIKHIIESVTGVPFCLVQHKNKGRVTLGLVYLGFKITVSSSVFLFDRWRP
nr:hypothetical protein CFP56_65287 [Quercus suber]